MEIVKQFKSDKEMAQWLSDPKHFALLKQKYPPSYYRVEVNVVGKRIEVEKLEGLEGEILPPKFKVHPHSEKEAQDRADEIANHLFKVMGGEWQTKVWHSTHYNYVVFLGGITIWEHLHQHGKPPTYHAHISEEFKMDGAGSHLSTRVSELIEHTLSPEMAYVSAVSALRTLIRQYTATIKLNLELLDVESIQELQTKIKNNWR